jgi:hypothetical protein
VEYELTEFGRRFSGIIAEVRRLQASIDAAPEQARAAGERRSQ